MNRRFVIAAAVVLVILIAFFWRRSPGVQVPAAFARLADAVDRGDGAGLLRELHPDYDFAANWPQIGGEVGDEEAKHLNLRPLVFHALTSFFQMRATDPISMRYTIDAIEPQDDGTVKASVTITFPTRSGGTFELNPPLEHHEFILARSGLVSLLVIRHAPISYTSL